MSRELIVDVIGVLAPIATFFIGRWVGRRDSALELTRRQVEAACRDYMELRRTNRTAGLDGLRKAGAAGLASDKEVRDLIQMIQVHGEKSPLGSNPEWFEHVDLKAFLKWSVDKGIDFHRHQWDGLVEAFRKEAPPGG